jgi:hypothetical protein
MDEVCKGGGNAYFETERRCRVVNILASYSESPGFKYRPGDRPSWQVFVVSLPPGEFRSSTLKLGHDRFLATHFQFIIHLPPFQSTLYRQSHVP